MLQILLCMQYHGNISSKLSEAFASELPENRENMFTWYYITILTFIFSGSQHHRIHPCVRVFSSQTAYNLWCGPRVFVGNRRGVCPNFRLLYTNMAPSTAHYFCTSCHCYIPLVVSFFCHDRTAWQIAVALVTNCPFK